MRETREERRKEADDDDVGGGEYIERASHSPLPPFVLRPREGKEKGKTRVLGENAERHKTEEKEKEGREDGRMHARERERRRARARG